MGPLLGSVDPAVTKTDPILTHRERKRSLWENKRPMQSGQSREGVGGRGSRAGREGQTPELVMTDLVLVPKALGSHGRT